MQEKIIIIPGWQQIEKRSKEIQDLYNDFKSCVESYGIGIDGDYCKESSDKIIAALFYSKFKNIRTMLKYNSKPIILSVGESPMSEYVIDTEKAKKALKYVDYIITWDSKLTDNRRIFKYNLSYDFRYRDKNWESISFNDRKLLTLISGNLQSRYKNELYSERKRIIEYFENLTCNVFDFYGRHWDLEKRKYKNYKGAPESKYEVYSKYRFAICFENFREADGYITEKIIDCFMSGIVPVYCGASDVGDYIPANCFISYNQFKSIEEMVSYLRGITEEEYREYLNNIRSFIDTQLEERFGMRQQAAVISSVAKLPKVLHKSWFGYLLGLASLCLHQEIKIIRYGYFNTKTIKRKLLRIKKKILNKR